VEPAVAALVAGVAVAASGMVSSSDEESEDEEGDDDEDDEDAEEEEEDSEAWSLMKSLDGCGGEAGGVYKPPRDFDCGDRSRLGRCRSRQSWP